MPKKTVRKKKKPTPHPIPRGLYVACMAFCLPIALLMIFIEPIIAIFLLLLLLWFTWSFFTTRKSKKPAPIPASKRPQHTVHSSTNRSTPHPAPKISEPVSEPELPKINISQFLDKTERFHVAGVSYHIDDIEALGKDNPEYDLTKTEMIDAGLEDERIYEYEFFPSDVQLIEEPDNKYDPNAIKVVIDNTHVGYIKKGSCSRIRKLLRSGKIRKIDAEIGGGKYKYLYSEYDYDKDKDVYFIDKDKKDYFVTIEITYST